MEKKLPSQRLIFFTQHVSKTRGAQENDLRVLDLRLECRQERLTEYSDWTINELDMIEEEAVRYGDESNLAQVLAGEVSPSNAQTDMWLHSPSPVAWS